ncbi:MAG: trypsin-like peptidase domain-containing protein [Planctomycetota bacterium]
MSVINRNWPVTIGIVIGVLLGVVGAKVMEGWPSPVIAESDKEGHKAITDQAKIFRNAAKTIAPSVVNITTLARIRVAEGGGFGIDNLGVPFYRRPRIKEGLTPRSAGSGFVFDATNGYVLTNNHVVAEGESYVVRLADKREVEAQLIGADPQTDVAVLKIDGDKLTAATLGNSDEQEVGDWVLAVGNPFGLLEQTVTAGIISAKGRRGLGLSNYEDYLQTDAAINQGNSGGPLVNLNGEVVGVNTAIFSRSGGYQGIGFAIPINQARKIALQLIKFGVVVRGWVGIEAKDLTPQESKRLRLTDGIGVSVEGVYLRGPAQRAGLLPGDILLKINNKAIHSASDVRDLVAEIAPETQIKLIIRRHDEEKTLNLVVGTQPKGWGVSKE